MATLKTKFAGEREDLVTGEQVKFADAYVPARRNWLFFAHVLVILTNAAFIIVACGALMTNSVDNFQRGWWVTMWYAILTVVFTVVFQGIAWWMAERHFRPKVSANHWNTLFNSLALGIIISAVAIILQYSWLVNHGNSFGAPVINNVTPFGALHIYYVVQALSIAAYATVIYLTSLAVVVDMYPEVTVLGKGFSPLENAQSPWRRWLFWGLLGFVALQIAYVVVFAGALLTNTIDNLQRGWWISTFYAGLSLILIIWIWLAWFFNREERQENVKSNHWATIVIAIVVSIVVTFTSLAWQFAWLGEAGHSFGAPVINTATSFGELQKYYYVQGIAIVSCLVNLYVAYKALMMVFYPEKKSVRRR